ncbi:hypothetical protein [Pseudomonas graminis]
MPNPNDEYPFILEKTRYLLLVEQFHSVGPDVIKKYFPLQQSGRPDLSKLETLLKTFDLDLQKMKSEDPTLYEEVAILLRSNCDMQFNAHCSPEQVENSNSLIDYSRMVSQTSDVNKYFRS